MNFHKKYFFIALTTILFFAFIILICVFIFMSKNFISINGYINTKNTTEFVITDDKLNETTLSPKDEEYKSVNTILSNAKIHFYSNGLLEYDIAKDVVELKKGGKTKKLYTYNNENSDNMFIIIHDFFEDSDTSKKLDYPYYIVAQISLSDYYKIFPKSSLLFENNITAIINTDVQADSYNEQNGKLYIRNDNDCAIRFEKISYNDDNISITANASENISPHSDYDIEIKIKAKNEDKNVSEYLQDSNLKITFYSVDNIDDKLDFFNIEYHDQS